MQREDAQDDPREAKGSGQRAETPEDDDEEIVQLFDFGQKFTYIIIIYNPSKIIN